MSTAPTVVNDSVLPRSTGTSLSAAEREVLEREAVTHLVRQLSSSAHSMHDVLTQLSDVARRIVCADGTCVLELEGERWRVTATSGTTERFAGTEVALMPAPSLFRDAIASLHPVFTNDGDHDPRVDPRFRQPLNIQQAAVAPIIVEGAVTGLLVCINTQRGAFDGQDMAVLQRLADHTALALRSAGLMRLAEAFTREASARAVEAALQAQHNAVLARTANVLAAAVTRDGLFHGLARVMEEELGAVGCSIYEIDADVRHARLEFQSGPGQVDPSAVSQDFWQTKLGAAVDAARPFYFDDFPVLSNALEISLTDPIRREGIESLAILPLSYGESVRGLLSLRFLGKHRFDDDERKLLVQVSTQVAIALRNAGYFSNLELRAARLTALAQAQQHLTRVVSRDAVWPAIIDAVGEVVPTPHCELFFAGVGGLKRAYGTHEGKPVELPDADERDLSFVRATFESGIPRVGAHLRAGAEVERGTVELCAPVRFGQRSLGVLRLIGGAGMSFDLQDLDLVTILARHAGTVVETARLFSAQDLERQRAEAAAELARAALHADRFAEGAASLLRVLDRVVPTGGKALGVSRSRDGLVEYVAASGTLAHMLGHRPMGTGGVSAVSPDGQPVEVASLRDLAPESIRAQIPDEWAFVVPLTARDRILGVFLATMPSGSRLDHTARTTLERLSASLALAFDALLLDEEERLARERERMLATALTTMDHPVFILDRAIIRYANPAAVREYGWPLADLSGMSFDQLVAGIVPRASITANDAIIERDVSFTEHVHQRRDGTEFPAAVAMSPISSDSGEVVGQVVSVRDMTEERAAAEQMRHAEKMVALGELVAGVAHEINNPLTGISAFAQLLLEEPLGAEQRESVVLIKRESDRAKAVIRDLLLFARKGGSADGPVDVNEMLEQTLRLRSYHLRNLGVDVALVLDPGAPIVRGDSQKLQQVLLNVIANAEHAMAGTERPRLTLRTAREGDRVHIVASDTGHGMAPEVRRRIFEPFYTTKPAGVGTRLGSNVSYDIVQTHGGTIEVHSEPGTGTVITINLPAADPSGPLLDATPGASA